MVEQSKGAARVFGRTEYIVLPRELETTPFPMVIGSDCSSAEYALANLGMLCDAEPFAHLVYIPRLA